MTLKLVFIASLLDAQHLADSVKNKLTSLLVGPLGKALSGVLPLWCDRQMQDGWQLLGELVWHTH